MIFITQVHIFHFYFSMIIQFLLFVKYIKKSKAFIVTYSQKSIANCTFLKSMSEAIILASINPQCDKRLFIELRVQYMKTTSSVQHVVYTNCSWCKNKCFWQRFTCKVRMPLSHFLFSVNFFLNQTDFFSAFFLYSSLKDFRVVETPCTAP